MVRATGLSGGDSDGNLRDAKAKVTYEYDYDQLIAVQKPFGTDVKYEYGPPGSAENGVGRIVRVLDDAGFETRGYGKLGEVVRSTRTVKPLKPNDSPQTFETRFKFDSFGRMLSLWYPDGEQLDYTYGSAGLVTHAQGHRPETKHWPEATEVYLASMTYDEFGQRRTASMGNGATTSWTYEPDTQRLKHLNTSSQGRVLQALTYVYDLVGNVKSLTNALGEATGRRSGAVSYTYDYDDLYRLTTATGTAKSRPGVIDSFKTKYAFDEIHNMTRLDQKHWLTTANDPENETAHPPHTNHDFSYVYGNGAPHQATKIGDRNVVYDFNGNTLRECRDHGDANCQANSDKLRRYFWGEENELNAVIDGGGWNITRFIYDAGGQRVVKLGRGGESITVGQFFALKGRKAATKHVFIGETRIASKLLPSPGWEPSWSEGTTVSGPIVDGTATVTWDLGNGCNPSTYQPQKCPIDPAANPVLDRRPDTTKIKPATYYYHSDHMGSTSWVTDQNGRVHEHVEYFPYGEVWRDARYDSDGDPTHRQQFLFSAKEMDEETGLYYFGARYLDPVRARWVSVDPILWEWNQAQDPKKVSLYAYAQWSPLLFVDPNGKDSLSMQLRNSLEFLERHGLNDHLTVGEMIKKGLISSAIAPYGGRTDDAGPPPEIEELVQKQFAMLEAYVGSGGGAAVRGGRKVVGAVRAIRGAELTVGLAAEASAARSASRIINLLRPGGRLIGEAGTSPQIRILSGGRAEAEALFSQLAEGGEVLTGTNYPGTLVQLPGGARVGLRPVSKSGPITIDVILKGLGIREIKYLR